MNSQIGQDEWVLRTLNYKRGGYFLDIGAFDGVQISNTWYMEKNLDWTGICIEAGAENYKGLVKNRNCTCLNLALFNKNSIVEFAENWTVGKIGAGQSIVSITFPKLLKKYNVPKVIDYISLDIEGMEYEVLKLFPFKSYHVNCWSIEYNAYEDGGVMRDKIRELMKDYILVPSGHDFEDWFVNPKIC